MKKFLKISGVILVIIFAYCLIAIVFFDSHYHGEKSIVIKAPTEKVWQNVNSMKAINSWSPWMKLDKNLERTYKGNSGVVGDFFAWKGNDKVGEGEQEITVIEPNKLVTTKMHFIKPFEDYATSNIKLEPAGNDTKVTWDIDFECETMMKPMKPILHFQMMSTFEEGLNDLKTLSER